jgi:integrase/recombinase XerD
MVHLKRQVTGKEDWKGQESGSMQAEIQAFLSSLESQPCYSMSTRLSYANDLARFLAYLQGTQNRPPEISDIQPKSIASFLSSEKLEGKKPNTLLRRKAAIRLFKIYLSNTGDLSSKYMDDGELAEVIVNRNTSTTNLQYLPLDQVHLLMKTIEGGQRPVARRDSAILALLLHTGLSVSKLISLDMADVNLSTGKICMENGQGEAHWYSLDASARYIDRYLKEGRPDLNPYPGETALFISQIGSRLTRQGVWQILKHWGTLSQASSPITPRAIRHTAALQLSRKGLPLAHIQALLGHSNLQSTLALLRRLEAVIPNRPVTIHSTPEGEREQTHG